VEALLAVVLAGLSTKDQETVGTLELNHGPQAYLSAALALVLARA